MRLDGIPVSLRRLTAVFGLLLPLAACSGAPGSTSGPQLTAWSEGPVGWLLLPEERRRIRHVGSRAEAIAFIEEFWRRRDPDRAEPGNPIRETFLQRVEAADQLYPERGLRGSLTDRGGALILLGSPSHLHVTSRPELSWDVSENRPQRVTTQRQSYEIWGFRLEDLSPRLVELVADRGGQNEALVLQLTFARGSGRTSLVGGDDLLELAARALVKDG